MSRNLVSTLVASGNNDLASWVLSDGAISRFGRGTVRAMALSPDGASLAVATPIGLWWYELATMQPIALWETERGMVTTIAISHDGRLAATGNGDGVVKVWDIQRSVCITQIVRPAKEVPRPYSGVGIKCLAFSPDNQYLAATGIRDEIVYTWYPGTGTPLTKFHDPQRESRIRALTRPVAFSPDGRLLACTAPAGTIDDPDVVLVWDVVSGECITCLAEQPSFVHSLCFSPCGQSLAIGGYKGMVQVWNVNTWEQQGVSHEYDGVSRMSVCYSQEGVLHAMERDTIVVWDVERHEKRYTHFEEEGNLQSAIFSSSSHFVVAGAKEWTVWSPGDIEPRRFPHSHTNIYPNSVEFSRDGKRLVAGSRDDSVLLWDIAKPLQPPTFFKLSGDQHAVSVSASGKIHATGFGYDRNTVKVWEVGENTPHMTFTLPDQDEVVTAAALSPTGNLLACGASKGKLYVWDVTSEDVKYVLIHPLLEDGNRIRYLIFSHDSKRLVSIESWGPMAKLWDLDSGEEIHSFSGKDVHAIAFSPCDDVIASGSAGEIRFSAAPSYETFLTIHEAQERKHPHVLFMALCFSPCGRYLASGEWWTHGRMKVPIQLWDVATGENITTFWGHSTDIQDLAFSPDGTLLVSGSYDDTLLLWDLTPYISNEIP